MTVTDWIIDIALVPVVLRQLRESRLTAHAILLPLAIVGWAAAQNLHEIPTAGNDLPLILAFAAAGAAFGLGGGLLTRVRHAAGHIRIKATPSAAALWLLTMGFRLGFAIWAAHASGAARIGSFSAAHDITGAQAWVAALILMAFAEVLVRLGAIVLRAPRVAALARRRGPATAAPKADAYV